MPKLTNLREIREARWMTQAELAGRAGVQRSTISRLEGGADAPFSSTVLKLAEALKVDPNDLTGTPSFRRSWVRS
jgi:transcriptional regulator with XRE-family HTH domain